MTPLFRVEDVEFRYRESTALSGVTLAIEAGENVALIGANGSGKSTLLRILDALYFPQRGSVHFEGRPLTESSLRDDAFALQFRRRVGLLFQNSDVQLFNATVFDEVAFGPLHLGWNAEEVRRRVEEALERVAIADLRDRPPHHLSGGEKKKVALASVLVSDPDVLLLDEPTAALDPRSQTQMIELLLSWGSASKTVITATHDLHMLEDIATRCIVFERGRIVAEGAPADILANRDLLVRTNLIHSHRTHPPHHTHGPHVHEDGS